MFNTTFENHISVKRLLVIFITLILFFQASANEVALNNKTLPKVKDVEKAKKSDSTSNSIIIESQIKGSQEQPKVIYIMPWHGIEGSAVIDGSNLTVNLPKLRPINPKKFKQQSAYFYNLNKRVVSKNATKASK